MLETGETLKN